MTHTALAPDEGYFAWSPGVHCAIAHTRPVLLSVPANAYFALPSDATEAVRRLLAQGRGERVALGAEERALWDGLAARGLARAAAEPAFATSAPGAAKRTALETWRRYQTPVPAADVRDFLVANASVRLRLKLRGLDAALARVARVRARRRHAPSADLETLARRYNTARILLTTRKRACLPDSLTAFEFFAQRGVVGDVVLGVRPNPVTAHAWLERDGVTLNDNAANVGKYTEILRA